MPGLPRGGDCPAGFQGKRRISSTNPPIFTNFRVLLLIGVSRGIIFLCTSTFGKRATFGLLEKRRLALSRWGVYRPCRPGGAQCAWSRPAVVFWPACRFPAKSEKTP